MKVEIQLRTIAMDFWASLEHQLKYKKNVAEEEWLLRELRECADISAQLDDRMGEIRRRLQETK
jgi:putative GTP pyrophosphokinase